MSSKPNILYLHCHDAGRYIAPYGHAIPTPNLSQLSDEGVLFRNAHTPAPTCSPSRSALLTGKYPHQVGMLGLAHLGWSLDNVQDHFIHHLNAADYRTALCGIQHESAGSGQPDHEVIGYQECLEPEPSNGLSERDAAVARAAAQWLGLQTDSQQPFFLSCGFFLPHREFVATEPKRHEAERPERVRVMPTIPDNADTRQDTAEYIASVRLMDRAAGIVLDALREHGLEENTIVIATTDHGPAFPGMKCNLTDHGTGVFLIMRDGKHFRGGQTIDAMVSHLDLLPTLCECCELPEPPGIAGKSIIPLVEGKTERLHEYLFGEVTYHASYQPMRSVRTDRWKLIRRFDTEWLNAVLCNVDDGPSKQHWMDHGWHRKTLAATELYDLCFDPAECHNLAESPEHTTIRAMLEQELQRWMANTSDPLLSGAVSLPPNGIMCAVDDYYVYKAERGQKKYAYAQPT